MVAITSSTSWLEVRYIEVKVFAYARHRQRTYRQIEVILTQINPFLKPTSNNAAPMFAHTVAGTMLAARVSSPEQPMSATVVSGGRQQLVAQNAKKTTAEVAAFKWLMLAATTVAFSTPAWAQGNNVGKMEYQSSCAACHGMDAKGNGPVSKELKTRPADLTVLAKNNNGVFPYDTVYQMIDGRNTTIRSHGTREMPIWGYRFGPPQAFRYKNRMLAVIDYLKHIQKR